MRIAVFDHVGNWGGGSRFVRALVLALAAKYPETEITLFGNRASLSREESGDELQGAGIEVRHLSNAPLNGNSGYFSTRLLIRKILQKIRILTPSYADLKLKQEIEGLAGGYDLAFFPWPYFIECPQLTCPIVAVFHDFNFKYIFGSLTFSNEQAKLLDRQIGEWIAKVKPVVSSEFTASELVKHYPQGESSTEVIHLAPFAISNLSSSEALSIVEGLGIKRPYMLYPTNLCAHKNVGMLLHAMYLLREMGVQLDLVLTGPGTDIVTGSVSKVGMQREGPNEDIIGLGYVSNLQMDALIQSAKIVVSSSLYEAGNGPGLEAWSRGIPVVMADIPAFREHMSVLGVKATVFDPHSAMDIAKKVNSVITNYEQASIDAEQSREALQRYTWEDVAHQYYSVFSQQVETCGLLR